ncbi:tRNA (adenosine(37)-N6)-dimethylallyltransferase MiaA [Liquorilactobacillus sicerae]|uniref:tRNA (adenosine(37)-N6)-dimethylallyltransferase MiaA n=1 Tax=Liquorilactobacillus sicerae TaxID=1416943 RepID=UPI003CFFEA91
MTTKLLLIVGPTAVGKTDLSLKIAQKFNGEIISGDSMQIYRNLDIGTAKVSMTERKIIKHYLIDICQVDQSYSVADFIDQCQFIIDLIKQKHKLPMIVGGTGFYLQALLDNFHLGGIQSTGKVELRRKWEAFAQAEGKDALWQKLNKIDPLAAKKIPPANQRRIIRALEVQQLTNKLFSAQHDFRQSNFDPLILGLNFDRQLLYQRINQRVDLMFQQGLLAEARWLYDQGPGLPAGKGIGYKELFPYFAGQTTLADAKELIKKNSRHYAKRQLTWFRNKMKVTWLDPTDTDFEKQAFDKIDKWLQKG